MRYELKQERFLFHTEIARRQLKFMPWSIIQQETGLYYDGYVSDSWTFSRFEDDIIFTCSAELPKTVLKTKGTVVSLAEYLWKNREESSSLFFLRELQFFLLEALKRAIDLSYLSLNRIFFLEPLEEHTPLHWLILPKTFIEEIEKNTSQDFVLQNTLNYVARDYVNANQYVSVFYSSIVYHSLIGSPPFWESDSQLDHATRCHRLENRWFVPLADANNVTMKPLLEFLDNHLVYPNRDWSLSDKRWDLFELTLKECFTDKLSIFQVYPQKILKLDSLVTRKRHWRHHRIKYLIGFILFIILGLSSISFLKNFYSPASTSGLSPKFIVEKYYEAINNFDDALMNSIVAKDGPKVDANYVTQFYVINKIRKGYEGSTGLVDFNKWLLSGKPPLKEGEQLAGIENLTIEKADNSTLVEPRFLVSYEKWFSEYEDTKIIIKHPKINDELSLCYFNRKKTWQICNLIRSL